MAKRIFHSPNFSPTATADAPTTLTSGTYMALKGGAANQLIDVLEVMISGFAGASSPTILQLARAGTLEVTPTALAAPVSDGLALPTGTALASPVVSFTAAATGPQRSTAVTDARLDMGLNAFGGIKRWVAAPGAEWKIVGNTASAGESFLSSYTGGTTGNISAHIIYEPY